MSEEEEQLVERKRYFVDTEFVDDGKTIDLISIGIACGDGRELYLQSTEFNIDKASPWVRENVIMHLDPCPHIRTNPPPTTLGTFYGAQSQHKQGQCTFEHPARGISGLRGVKLSDAVLIGAYEDCPWRTRMQMRNEVLHFFIPGVESEIWGWCAGYDWVAFCQLFGTMMDLPQGYPHYIHEFQQVLDDRGITDADLPPQKEGLHHALSDARHLKRLWNLIYKQEQTA